MGQSPEAFDALPQHVFRWLEATQRRMSAELGTELDAEVHALGMRRVRVLQLVPPGGARQKDLAESALVTKQAMAELIDDLEARGLVERTPDPSDGRAWLVVRSARGEQMSREFDEAMRAVETELSRAVGPERYATFTEVLRELGERQI